MAQSSIYTVKELNARIKGLIVGEPWLQNVCVEGELTGVGRDKKGHLYFSLKDMSGVLPAVMFAGKQTYGLNFTPKNGDKVHAIGSVDVFERDGRYQLYVTKLMLVGAGEVNAALQKLIARLEAMGLFSEEYKKPIPAYPRKIGIVTAGNKAAISDIKAVAKTRDPYAQLYCYPATVQGRYAAADISYGIEVLDSMGMDVIIIGRGGGSREDLWAFNEEQVAWAVFNAETPIITATGHEIDTTVADMVADRRESNPSTAVMHALPVVSETVAGLDAGLAHMTAVMNGRVSGLKGMLAGYERQLRLLSPAESLGRQRQKLDELEKMLSDSMSGRLDSVHEGVFRYESLIGDGMRRRLDRSVNYLALITERIHGLSPTAKLVNGFGYISSDGVPVRSADDVKSGDELDITLHDGDICAVVK